MSCYLKPNSDCNRFFPTDFVPNEISLGAKTMSSYTLFPIDLTPNKIPFGAESIGKVLLQLKVWVNLAR